KEYLKEIDEKGIETVPEDAIGGIAANIDGPKLSKYINKSLSEAKLLDQIPSEYKDLFDSLLGILGDINGNLAGYMVAPLDVMFAVESKDNSADRIAELVNSLGDLGTSGFTDAPDFANADLSYEPAQFTDDETLDDDEDYDYGDSYDLGYGQSSFSIEKTADGYCCSDGSMNFWFGNKNGALYFTNNESLKSSAFKKADKPVPSELVSFATSRRFMYFINLGKVKDYTSAMDKDVKKAFNAFDEIVSKISYITFSMK
ncbi:MAG: DUF4836 family protein, partial [Muribaculaceae bacterium]|nr:DUF4836 family protein [Muribaculaceae bacterium]